MNGSDERSPKDRPPNGEPPNGEPSSGTRAGGETPARRFGQRDFPPGYAQKGDVDRAPFEGHPEEGGNVGRPHGESPEPATEGQHGQRPANMPDKKG